MRLWRFRLRALPPPVRDGTVNISPGSIHSAQRYATTDPSSIGSARSEVASACRTVRHRNVHSGIAEKWIRAAKRPRLVVCRTQSRTFANTRAVTACFLFETGRGGAAFTLELDLAVFLDLERLGCASSGLPACASCECKPMSDRDLTSPCFFLPDGLSADCTSWPLTTSGVSRYRSGR